LGSLSTLNIYFIKEFKENNFKKVAKKMPKIFIFSNNKDLEFNCYNLIIS